MKKDKRNKEDIAEDFCFMCKDGGLLLVCEFKRCLKAYHPQCVGKDSTFLEAGDRYICSWHSCFICNKSAKLQCFCCPNSVCRACIGAAEFVQVKRSKGFCNNCLKLALLIEENVDVDSDGGKVDFKDTETWEYLFKDYWEIIKEKESLTLDDLHTADALLKKGENYKDGSDSDKVPDDGEDVIFDADDMGNKSDDEVPLMEESKGQKIWMKAMLKRSRSKKQFIGWGSKELLDFLISIGKDTSVPLTQLEVSDIIKDYVQENKLLNPIKKKRVVCDARLHSLFGRKSVSRLKVYDLLEAHFAANQESEDDFLFGSEDENAMNPCKRSRRSTADGKAHEHVPNYCNEKVLGVPKYLYASVTANNIKLVYLRKSLLVEFLKTPDSFESKVMDCFVRVKGDPNDYSRRHRYQLEQVTGLKKTSETYRIGEISTDFLLQVSNMQRNIHISMVSEDDFSEEECKDLHQRVKDGLLKRPTMVDLDRKARSLHEDITNHWINREISLLQNLIDRANEKGWRRELFEYLERKELLQTPAERFRLLEELPKAVADEELELEVTSSVTVVDRENKGNGAASNVKTGKGENKGNGVASNSNQIGERREIEGNGVASNQIGRKQGKGEEEAVSCQKVEKRERNGDPLKEKSAESGVCSRAFEAVKFDLAGNGDVINEKKAEREAEVIGDAFVVSGQHDDMEEQQHLSAQTKESSREHHIIGLDEDDLDGTNKDSGKSDRKKISAIEIINLDDEDDDEDMGGGTRVIASEFSQKICAPENNPQADLCEQMTEASEHDEKIISISEHNSPDLSKQKTETSVHAEKIISISEHNPPDLSKQMTETSDHAEKIISISEHNPPDLSEQKTQVSEHTEKIISVSEHNPPDLCEEKVKVDVMTEDLEIWHYIDPNGDIQGPFTMFLLGFWSKEGYFDEDFKVWKTGQSKEDAVLLKDALCQAFTRNKDVLSFI